MATAAEKKQDKVVNMPTPLHQSHIRKYREGEHKSRSWHVVAMPDWSIQVLSDRPEIWRTTQGDRNTSLSQDDRVYVVGFDRSWAAEYRAMSANRREVHLSKPLMFWSGAQPVLNWEDSNLIAEWTGWAFTLYRETDGDCERQKISEGLLHMDAVNWEVRHYYTRRA